MYTFNRKSSQSLKNLLHYTTTCTADAQIIVHFPRAVMEKPLLFGSEGGKLDRCWLHDEHRGLRLMRRSGWSCRVGMGRWGGSYAQYQIRFPNREDTLWNTYGPQLINYLLKLIVTFWLHKKVTKVCVAGDSSFPPHWYSIQWLNFGKL